jgi:hypothetical protein
MTNYEVSANTNNNSNKTTQDKTNNKYKKTKKSKPVKDFQTQTRLAKNIYRLTDCIDRRYTSC